MLSTITSVLTPIHREGIRFLLIFAAVTLLLLLLYEPIGWLGVVATAWCAYFFRDPERATPTREGLVVSPADGLVNLIAEVTPPKELALGDDPRIRVSIFMNVFNCHVNRVPISGKIRRAAYQPGKFVNAMLDKASDENERQGLVIHNETYGDIGVVQIAGLVARRIVCDVQEGDVVSVGGRYGLIRFGSRLDVYLPPGQFPLVAVGQTTLAGETVIADLNTNEKAREVVIQ